MSKTPLLLGMKSPQLAAAAGIQPHGSGRGSDAGANLYGGPGPKRPAPSHAKKTGGPALNSEGKPIQGGDEAGVSSGSDTGANLYGGPYQQRPAPSHGKETGGPALNSEGKPIQGGDEDAVIIPKGQQFTADALADLAMRLGGAKMAEAFAKTISKNKKLVNDGKKRESEAPAELDLDILRHQSSAFAMLSRHTTMADAATAFSLAVDGFASGKDEKKRVTDTKLCKAGMALSAAADRAPASEAIFVNLASRLTGDAQLLLLSDVKQLPLRSRWRRWRHGRSASVASLAGRTSMMERLLATTTSSPELRLPVHTAKGSEKELVDRRQIVYAVAVALPVSLLASAAGIRVFAGRGAWVAGVGVFIWIIAAAGMILNQYGKFNWEKLVARHLNRLCLLGGGMLLSFYAFRAYFPSETWALCLLIGIAVTLLGGPWVMGMIRADDLITAGDSGMTDRTRQNDGQED